MESLECPACGGQVPTELGALGRLLHLRCRDCGMDCSVDMKPRSDAEIDADFQKARKDAHEKYNEELDRETE